MVFGPFDVDPLCVDPIETCVLEPREFDFFECRKLSASGHHKVDVSDPGVKKLVEGRREGRKKKIKIPSKPFGQQAKKCGPTMQIT